MCPSLTKDPSQEKEGGRLNPTQFIQIFVLSFLVPSSLKSISFEFDKRTLRRLKSGDKHVIWLLFISDKHIPCPLPLSILYQQSSF